MFDLFATLVESIILFPACFLGCALTSAKGEGEEDMDELWGEQVSKLRAEDSTRGQLFEAGNYAMFVHWGLYSVLANAWEGKTYYGIGEWLMHPRMADIPIEDYRQVAEKFNPTEFDADAIVTLAKDAGMKYVVFTAKHHEGFAMYGSKVDGFNIVDAAPFGRDPMLELAEACRKQGLGLGFYYSQNQDWVCPGGTGGPTTAEDGSEVGFDTYFQQKCRPQIEEITTEYGPIELVWFDTPGKIPRNYVEELIAIIRKNQPNALVSGRVGHGMGDYVTHGDMEVPNANVEGLWETVDTTNDSWGYAWYDENWKTPKDIVQRLVSTVARGGTYMLNVGPRGDGSVPEQARKALRISGAWVQRYPFVVYDTDPSPWGHALPWGDVTVKDATLFLSVFTLPDDGILNLPGLVSDIVSVSLLVSDGKDPLSFRKEQGWVRIELPSRFEEDMIPVLEVQLEAPPEVKSTWGVDPAVHTMLLTEFALVQGAEKSKKRWMEKFGEWKHTYQVDQWQPGGKAAWEVDVLSPGTYQVDLTYAGEGRLVWGIQVAGADRIQNEQTASHVYQTYPIGWIEIPESGLTEISVFCLDGKLETASLKALHLRRILR